MPSEQQPPFLIAGTPLPRIAQARIEDATADIARTREIVEVLRALVRLLDPCGERRKYALARDIAALLKRLPRARRPLSDARLQAVGWSYRTLKTLENRGRHARGASRA